MLFRLLTCCLRTAYRSASARQRCYGLSLKKTYLNTAAYQDNLSGAVWTRLMNPCANCERLIDLFGGNSLNFDLALGQTGAPP
jgi:hypothetical protein